MLNAIKSLFRPEAKPALEHGMRTHAYDKKTDRLYLYAFEGKPVNGYFIREEVAADLVLRGLPMTARLGVTGDLFVDERGAGIYGVSTWEHGSQLHELAANELDKEAERLENNAPVNYVAPGTVTKRRIGFAL